MAISRFFGWLTGRNVVAPTHPTEKNLVDDTGSSNPDALAVFIKDLESKKIEMKEALTQWMKNAEIAQAAIVANKDEVTAEHCELESHANIESMSEIFRNKLKGLFQSARANLHEELHREIEGHVRGLEQHITELYNKASDTAVPDAMRRKAGLHLCEASIVMLNELNSVLNHFTDEIDYCLKAEDRGEKAAQLILDVAILLVSGVLGFNLPMIQLHLAKPYRGVLFDEVMPEANELECDIAETKGVLKQANSLFENNTLFKPAPVVPAEMPQPAVGNSL